jgi:AdoMet-dependent rRNA methyltransferase SPB1
MPIASIKIGVDLDPIPAIKGCLTFQADITTERCMALIRKELKHFKADCVLNDGAPNVGTNWSMDAYNQIELSLYALKIATQTLRKGGWFITKVFRSKDYNALMYVANQLFTKVESNKPQSSRSTSAEIFMVCQGYKAPDSIDPKLLDPKFALEEVEDDPNQGTSTEKITSLKKLLNQKVNRSGYEDGKSILFAECDFLEFLQAADPHSYLSGFNRFKLSKEALEAVKELRLPKDLELMCEDLKTCGRREFSELLKIRHKYNTSLSSEAKGKKGAEEVQELTPEQLEAQVDRELEQTIRQVEKDKKRRLKKDLKQQQKQEMMKKMSVIASTNINEDLELELDPKTRERMRAMMADEDAPQYFAKEEPDDAEMDPVERRYKFYTDGAKEADDEGGDSSDDASVDERVARVDRMADEIEQSM